MTDDNKNVDNLAIFAIEYSAYEKTYMGFRE